jgi:hypothetical protein
MNINRTLKIASVLLIVMVLTVAVYAFAAANTVPTSSAGDGNAVISGYTVTNVHYVLNGTDPSKIDSMTFTVSTSIPAGGAVQVKLISTGTTYTSCTVASGTNVTCTFSPTVSVTAADNLRVIIAQ